jgi:hypothetical protein
MKWYKLRSKKFRLALAVALLACLIVSGVVLAANTYAVNWSVVAGGGGQGSTGGGYSLSGTVGQPDVLSPMSGGSFTLTGGFWVGQPSTFTYFPAIKK